MNLSANRNILPKFCPLSLRIRPNVRQPMGPQGLVAGVHRGLETCTTHLDAKSRHLCTDVELLMREFENVEWASRGDMLWRKLE